MTRHHSCRVSPFGHPRIHARLTAPRGITQPPTSFIGSQCQGIHHAPLNTYNTKPKNESPTHTPSAETPKDTRGHQKNCTSDTQKPAPQKGTDPCALDARNHYPQIKHHTPPPKQGDNHTHPHRGRNHPRFPQLQGEEATGLLSQSPIVCLMINSGRCFPTSQAFVVHQNHTHYRCGPSTDSPKTSVIREMRAGSGLVVLLRKEVIQPHLPVRLPCYDFVPIADPTFDGSLPEGLGHRLRVLPTFMT